MIRRILFFLIASVILSAAGCRPAVDPDSRPGVTARRIENAIIDDRFAYPIPEADRKTFKVVVQDSYEMGGQNFTDEFPDEFKQRYGYDPVSYLPVYSGFVVNSQLESDRFLWDLRRLVADKVAYDYVGGLRDISHQHGLRT